MTKPGVPRNGQLTTLRRGAARRMLRVRARVFGPSIADDAAPRPIAPATGRISLQEPVVLDAASRDPNLGRRSLKVAPISPRLEWTPATKPHPRYTYRDEERATVQVEARLAVAALLEHDQFERHECPSCGGVGFRLVAETERHGFYFPTCVCRYCGLAQAQPRPTQAFYDEFYSAYYRRLFEGTPEILTVDRFRARAAKRPKGFVDWVTRQAEFKQRIDKDDLIIEVGCSAGMVVSRFAEAGYRTVGLDLDETFMRIGRELGYDLRVGKLASLDVDERPAMIYYHHVIEHIGEIGDELAECARLLPEGGLLAIAVPGLGYIDQAYRGDLLEYLQIAHVYNFSLTSLTALMRPHGFELVHGDETIRALFRRTEPAVPHELHNVERAVAVWRLKSLEQRLARSRG